MKNITFKWSDKVYKAVIDSITESATGLKIIKAIPTNSPITSFNLYVRSITVGQHGSLNILYIT